MEFHRIIDADEGREAPGAQTPRGGRLPFAVGGSVRGDAAFRAREGVRRSSFRFHCHLYDPRAGRVFVEAETVQVMYDYRTGRPVPMDADFLARARDYIGG